MTLAIYGIEPSDVRGLLGVTDDEIDDSVLSSKVHMAEIADSLDVINPELSERYTELARRVEEGDSTVTKTELKLVGRVQVYACYKLAQLVMPALPLRALKRETDGKAEGERVADPFSELAAHLKEKVDDLISRIGVTLAELGLTGTAVSVAGRYSVGSALATDPVTGEAA